MSRGVNKVILVGNLGKDPEVQNYETGKKVTFSLATSENQRDREGNETQHTEWHNIVMWRGLADIAETYLKKGSQVYLEGRLRSRSYEAKDGTKRFITEIQADNMVLLGGRREAGENTHSQGSNQHFTQPPASAASAADPATDSEEIAPF